MKRIKTWGLFESEESIKDMIKGYYTLENINGKLHLLSSGIGQGVSLDSKHFKETNKKDLIGLPDFIDCDLYLDGLGITSLKGCPDEIGGTFVALRNKLKSLEYGPKKVYDSYSVSLNSLTSLKGSPEYINSDFICDCNKLKDLKGGPKKVGKYYNCRANNLTSLEGAPEEVGVFACDEFTLISGKWNIEGWLEIYKIGLPSMKKLIRTLITDDFLDKSVKENPIIISLLDDTDLKEGVLKRTGLRDLSRLGRSIKSGLI